jgi:PIN domain
MPEIFLSIVLDTSTFLNRRYANLEHLHGLIKNGIIRITGVEIHIPYAVKTELRLHAAGHRDRHVQKLALGARRWIEENQAGLQRESWMQNETAAAVFPNRTRDQVLHHAQKHINNTLKFAECWLVTEDKLLQFSAKANGLQALDIAAFEKQLTELFPVHYLNTKWMIAAMENRMEREMMAERRKRAKFILVVEAGVLLKTKRLESFLSLLAEDWRPDFAAGIQLDVPKIVMDRLGDVQRDIACWYRDPEALINRVVRSTDKYGPSNRDSHLIFQVEQLSHYVQKKSSPQGHEDYDEGVLRYCRQLVESMGDTHVVALLTDDGRKRKLMRTEQFQVMTLWPS